MPFCAAHFCHPHQAPSFKPGARVALVLVCSKWLLVVDTVGDVSPRPHHWVGCLAVNMPLSLPGFTKCMRVIEP
jgi:hypothetical protein